MNRFNIDLKEAFPHLPSAPIVEAVIHWQARAGKSLDRDLLLQQLKDNLPDYPDSKAQHEQRFEVPFGPEQPSAPSQQTSWHGFRFESDDKRYIAQFTRNGFVFSRLAPYENWERFVKEAKRLWLIHVQAAEPPEVQRLGVRFINRIAPVKLDALSASLNTPPTWPVSPGLPVDGFLHRDTFSVPGHPYRIKVNQAVQPLPTGNADEFGLILDIDVFTDAAMATEGDESALDARLTQMRWLKNKAFFTFLTQSAIDQFKEVMHE